MDNEKKLTDQEIDSIADAASEVEGADIMHQLKNDVNVNPEAPLEAATVNDEDEIDVIAKSVESGSMDLFSAADPEKYEEASQQQLVHTIKSNMKSGTNSDITDEEAYEFIRLVSVVRDNPNAKIYNELPKKFRDTIDKLMLESGIPVSNRDVVARMILMEFMNNAEVSSAFVDLEKALNEALNIPSIVDLYSEHTKNVMEKNIPEMIEKLKDEYPEKAEMLAQVKDEFTNAYTFSRLRESYEIGKVFKAVRRNDTEFKRALDSFNRKNIDSKFKMYDIKDIPSILEKVLCLDPLEQVAYFEASGLETPDSIKRLIEMVISVDDIEKFCTLLALSADSMDGDNVIHASYMYYLTKNIIMLKHTQEAKTQFSAELINNICDIIALIRNKEAEFYAQNPHLVKPKSIKKSHSARRGKK